MILSRTVLFHSSRNANARLYGSKAFCCSRARQSFGRPLLNLPATATNATSFAARSSFSSNANAENAYSNTYIITKKERSAYRTLGVSVSSTYEEVKGTFLKLALKHHPDKTGKNSVDEFVKYRTAFETIRKRVVKRPANEDEDDDDDTAADWNDEEMQTWFYEETGEFLSFQMDQDTIDEVIKAFTTLSPGGRDPGEWEMARQLTEREARRKAGDLDDDDDDDGPLLQLTGSMNSGTTIRRRQRRWSR
jgi:hypothetical protein